MRERIIYLINQLSTSRATSEEQYEFASILQSGEHEELIKGLIDDDLASDRVNRLEVSADGFNSEGIFKEIVESEIEDRRQPLPWWRTYGSWIAAAVFLVVFSFGWYAYRETRPVIRESVIQSTSLVTVVGEAGQRKFVRLPDGSTVLLNGGSTINYDGSFVDRKVTLSGEGFFDVHKDPEHPFIVYSGNVVTKVLGTAFNIDARSNQIVVSVERGLVQVGGTNKVYARLRPLDQITVNNTTEEFEFRTISNNRTVSGWKKTEIRMDDKTFDDAMQLLSSTFGVEVEIQNEEIKHCRVSAVFQNGESLEEILSMVCGSRQAQFEINKSKVTISGGLSCN